MPLVDWDDAAPWVEHYGARKLEASGRRGVRVSYGAEWDRSFAAGGFSALKWRLLRRSLALVSRSRVLVVGCGFGYLVEAARAGGMLAWGLDSSAWIHANKGAEAPASVEIIGADVESVRPADLEAATGSATFDEVITENMLESYSAADLPAILDACDRMVSAGGRVSHLVQVNAASPFRSLGLSEWRAERLGHSFVAIEGR